MEPLNPNNECAELNVPTVRLENPMGKMYSMQRKLQVRLNCLPNADMPISVRSDHVIYWKHCVEDESHELLEWFDDRIGITPDVRLKEVQMEAIDILHFVFNIGIELNFTATDLTMMYVMNVDDNPLSRMTLDKVALQSILYNLNKTIVHLIRLLPWKHWKTYPVLALSDIRKSTRYSYEQTIQHALSLCHATGMTDQNVVDVYFAKNKENHNRQDNGY